MALIAHGPVGYWAAVNLVQLPLAQLTVVGVHDTDRDALTAVGRTLIGKPQHSRLSLSHSP